MFQQAKEKAELRNADRAREERKERLSSMNNSDGSKKPLRKKRSLAGIITIVVLCLLIVGMVVWALISQGILNRYQKAYTVQHVADAASGRHESKTYTVADANFFAGLLSEQNFPQGLFTPEGQAAMEVGREDLLKEVKRQLALDFALDFEQGDIKPIDQQERVDQLVDTLKERAASEKLSFSTYLANHYGKGMSEKTFRSNFKHLLEGAYVQQQKYSSFDYDEATLQAKYDEDPAKYDVVSYRFYKFPASEESSESLANNFNQRVSDEESFKTAATEADQRTAQGEGEDAQVPADPNLDTTLAKNVRSLYIEPEITDWLYSTERKANDHSVIKTADGSYQVVMFLERNQPQDPSYDSRHILLKVDESASEADQAKVKENIEKLKADFEAGNKSEESFADLAIKNSEDPGSANNGGLYQGIKRGQFVAEYEDWCLDPERKPGDVEIVKSVHGYHLIYFVRNNGPEWQDLVRSELRDADFKTWIDGLEKEVEVIDNKHADKVAR